jgi:hypothetical protein
LYDLPSTGRIGLAVENDGAEQHEILEYDGGRKLLDQSRNLLYLCFEQLIVVSQLVSDPTQLP